MVNRKRLVDTFTRLVGIDSLSLKERQMADHLTVALTDMGLTVQEDDAGSRLGGNAGNLYATLPGTVDLPPLLFSSHMDTVAPGLGKKAVLHGDGRITSDGTTVLGADDLAGVAAILEALNTIQEKNLPHRPIEVLFCIAEEIYCRGAAAFDTSLLDSKELYVLDLAGPVGAAASRAPAIISLTFTIHGRASHAGFAPEKGVHAIKATALAISRLELGHVGHEMTANVGVISGGEARNIVPDTCVVLGEVRSFDQSAAYRRADEMIACFRESAGELGAQVEVESELVSAAYEMSSDHPAVLRFQKACSKAGVPFVFEPTHGGSDYNALYTKGLRGLVIANAMMNIHGTDEYTTADELERTANLTLALMTSED